MKTLSIDIETFSSVDLSKCGVYKYTEAPDFDILLFGYSVDGGPVQVVDLLSGEELPSEIVAALTDDTVIKWAFNAQFERICLSRWLRDHGGFDNTGYSIPQDTVGNYLDPAAWHCTMIWSATMGLPLSLEGVGAVLGLDKQKLSEGKDLIKYFCQPCAPTKTNGGRTRNLPMHAPDKWAAFKRYNCRDVEVEQSIQNRLAKFPVPDSIWEEYHLDQEIYEAGAAGHRHGHPLPEGAHRCHEGPDLFGESQQRDPDEAVARGPRSGDGLPRQKGSGRGPEDRAA